jgi:hypothetical protein
MMYAYVVMIVLGGSPQFFIMERGLSETACQELTQRPDSGLQIDGKSIAGERSCVPEEDLPAIADEAALR